MGERARAAPRDGSAGSARGRSRSTRRPPAAIAGDVRAVEAMRVPGAVDPRGWRVRTTSSPTCRGCSRRASTSRSRSGIANISAREPEVLARGAAFLSQAHRGSARPRGRRRARVLDRAAWHRRGTGRLARMRALPRRDGRRRRSNVSAPRLLAALGRRHAASVGGAGPRGAHLLRARGAHRARAGRLGTGARARRGARRSCRAWSSDEARAAAHTWAAGYLELPNYANNWRRLGYGEDEVAGDGSERLIDAAMVWGAVDAIVDRVRAHLEAGADHVCVQVIEAPDTDTEMAALLALAPRRCSACDPRDRCGVPQLPERVSGDPAGGGVRRSRAVLRPRSIAAACSARSRLPICRSAQLTAFFTSLR